ncbi:class I SAM-dependent DNA methyltransferase [Maricaulis sp.]|uniref:class I SAM-dependent DNA methyltransferase n=1 Tax=Maricaulis sp. TaxID=1486257 RepID=UPI003A9185B0
MNAVEIEEAVSALAELPYDAETFPYAFLEAFGNKATTIKRLRAGSSNKSDLGGVLQANNIHILTCPPGGTGAALTALRESAATKKAKAKFILATDGRALEAEDINSGETIACDYPDFPDHFGFFLPLAGITTVKQIRESSFDIRATSRLNRLYVELLKDNPDWGSAERRHDMNHFMARLIFCFFAEDTDIFAGTNLFTGTVERMSARDASNTHQVIGEVFRAMNTKARVREASSLPRWCLDFPYVNGGLFSGSTEVPRFSKLSRSYLMHIGGLNWKMINPDIFGSMIQAVADDEERGALGMHYTSVPNILKVLNPLFLDDLRSALAAAGDSPVKLLNLRKRMARIRVFDPACGSGNFLVIAYKQMREIEAEINTRRGERDRRSDIPLTNFRGIELRDFAAEIARLALIIAEFQCDILYRGQQEALKEFLPLGSDNWIVCGNALRLDWLSVCPPTGTGVKHNADDLFHAPLDQAEIAFELVGGETYICGNPPYFGGKLQSEDQKEDLRRTFRETGVNWKSLDYVAGWFLKSAEYISNSNAQCALVSTNSICQGQQVPVLWPEMLRRGVQIKFAHTSFRWANLAARSAVVTVVVIGLCNVSHIDKKVIYSSTPDGESIAREVSNINPYIVAAPNVIVEPSSTPLNGLPNMVFGNMPRDAGYLLMDSRERAEIIERDPGAARFIYAFRGSEDFIHDKQRYCIWITDDEEAAAQLIEPIRERLKSVTQARSAMKAVSTRKFADRPHRFVQIQGVAEHQSIIVPRHTSEKREYLPVGLLDERSIIADSALAIYDAPIWSLAIVASRLHWIWISTVCGKIKTDFRYSNTIGWNSFPIPKLTEKNRSDLTRAAENILLAREAHFPATVADLYCSGAMPERLRDAHKRNDEILERIYIGRRFRNDTERLEVLFENYSSRTGTQY